ncbi:PEP-CTERM sorting domain-containing protein [Oceaniferula marina]|uniref:PEP-CTERM sorting domain-containing protein n=1 Tax=Oceaniferula marina TaxID=2748318 RepID=UPI001D03E4C7|nr:PEP-CTERM sorting domain-containing protein [Oceaniferula marina]
MKLKYIISASAMALVANASAATSLIINGDFETGLSGFHNYSLGSELGDLNYGPPTYGASLPDNWTTGPGETRIWSVTDQGKDDVISGSYAVRLDAASNGNPNGVPERLIQTGINLTVAQEYQFTTELYGQSNLGAELLVELIGTGANTGNDITVGTFVDTTDGTIQFVSSNFTATVGGEYQIQLSSANSPDGNHVFVDNIGLTAVPEPSSAALLGLGGLALILRRRK